MDLFSRLITRRSFIDKAGRLGAAAGITGLRELLCGPRMTRANSKLASEIQLPNYFSIHEQWRLHYPTIRQICGDISIQLTGISLTTGLEVIERHTKLPLIRLCDTTRLNTKVLSATLTYHGDNSAKAHEKSNESAVDTEPGKQ